MAYRDKEKQKAYQRKWRENNKERVRRYRRDNKDRIVCWKKDWYQDKGQQSYYDNRCERLGVQKDRRQKHRAFIDMIKTAYQCQNPNCLVTGCLPACCLDFHHRVKHDKSFTIGKSMTSDSDEIRKTLIDEMNKCSILCANCHRMVTSNLIDAMPFPKCNLDQDGIPTESH